MRRNYLKIECAKGEYKFTLRISEFGFENWIKGTWNFNTRVLTVTDTSPDLYSQEELPITDVISYRQFAQLIQEGWYDNDNE